MNCQKLLALAALAIVMGCATQYAEDVVASYWDRERVAAMPDDQIDAQNVDLQQMKKDKKLNIGVRVEVLNQAQGTARIPDFDKLRTTAESLANNYLARVKAYHVVVLDQGVSDAALLSGNDMDGISYHFLINMKISLTSETEQKYDFNETMYKCGIDWQLIDNRTKKNGLGSNSAPYIREALTCQNVTMRKTALTSMGGHRMSGSAATNAQNAYKNVIENSLIEFRAQLANRVPFGGRISSMRTRDGKVRLTVKAGPEEGLVNRMQMLVLNEEGDAVCVAETKGGAKTTETTLEVWRWLSESLKNEVLEAAGSKAKAEEWLDEEGNGLYAVCIGMPTPREDERKQIKDYE